LTASPLSTALRASSAAPSITDGNDRYVDDTRAWFEALSGSARFVRPASVHVDDLVDTVRAKVAHGLADSFLLGVKVVPAGGGHGLALPTGPISKAHNGRIRELLGRRHRGQLRVLTDLVRRTG